MVCSRYSKLSKIAYTTTFTYILDHFLQDIIDPRGIMVARNEYDANGRLIAHVDADGKRIEYTHDIAGRTEIIKDRNGHSSLFVYDNAGNVIAETNPEGETILHEYNDIYLETKRTDPLGNETSWSYDQQGNQLTETDSDGNTTTSTYNIKGEILTQMDPAGIIVINNQYSPDDNPFLGGGNLTKVSDALGNFTEFHWTAGQDTDLNTVVVNVGYTNTNGNRHTASTISEGSNSGLTGSIIDVKGLEIESTYDDEARLLTKKQIITDSNGETIAEYITTFEYNANGDTVKITDAKGNFIQREYNSINKISAMIDANGNRTEFEFDNIGNRIKTIYPDNTTELLKYDAVGNEVESVDRAGRVTKNIYDSADRVIEIIYPDTTPNNDLDNPRKINSYDQAGRLTLIKDANNNITSYVYDSKNRQIKIIDGLNNETNIIYDYLDREIQRIDALGRVTKFEYDVLSRLTKTIFPDNTPNDNLFISKNYDNEGFQLSETNYAGSTKQYEYNNAGYLLSVTDALLQKTEYTYDQRGNKLTQTDANGHTTTWVYDELSQISSRTLPEGQSESFTYDAFGNMVSQIDFNGDTTSYEYNNLNQQIKIIYTDDTEVISTYTLTGQIESITQTHGTTTYGYDQRDRLTRIDYPTGNFIAYLYDLNGNRTQVRTGGHIVDYIFDTLNRIETVTDISGITRYTYDAVGNKITQTNTNGTVATYTYNELDRLTNLIHTDANNIVIAGFQYSLDANGNRLSVVESTGRVVNYSYDSLDRLLSEEIIDSNNGNHLSEFSYDPVGNRLQKIKDGIETDYVYNNNDQLQSETTNLQVTTYTYDNNGNTLAKLIDGTLNTSYSYSKDNQMIKAITPSEVIDYLYDLSGIRQMQNAGGNITQYLIDPNRDFAQVFEEQDDTNTTQVTYTYGDDLISEKFDTNNYTYAYDGLGSTRILSDANGIVKNSYGYQAFGEASYQTGAVSNRYLYAGEQLDNNTNLYYLRSRYYNTSIGRFNKMDTWPGSQLSPLTLNKYAYVLNNPTNLVDPSGLFFGLGELLAAGQIRGIQSTTATTSYRVTLRKISKNLACVAVSELVEGVIVDTIIGGGIYLLQDNGQQYVGRSKDVLKRLKQHMKNTKKQVERIMAVFHIGDLANQRVIEQFFIDLLKTIKEGANQINSVALKPRSENSKRLRKLLKNLDFCKD